MKRLARTLSVLLTLTPFAIAFLRDRKAWILFGRGARRSPGHHIRRAGAASVPPARACLGSRVHQRGYCAFIRSA